MLSKENDKLESKELVFPALFRYNRIMIYRDYFQSPLGKMSLLADDDCLVGVYFEGQRYFEKGFEKQEILNHETAILRETKTYLQSYFSGKKVSPHHLPIKLTGTDFQKKVWTELADISYGEVTTYSDLARAVDCRSAQAIGNAVGKNPMAILIPCHRVLAADGRLRGYAAGLEKKSWLLKHEERTKNANFL